MFDAGRAAILEEPCGGDSWSPTFGATTSPRRLDVPHPFFVDQPDKSPATNRRVNTYRDRPSTSRLITSSTRRTPPTDPVGRTVVLRLSNGSRQRASSVNEQFPFDTAARSERDETNAPGTLARSQRRRGRRLDVHTTVGASAARPLRRGTVESRPRWTLTRLDACRRPLRRRDAGIRIPSIQRSDVSIQHCPWTLSLPGVSCRWFGGSQPVASPLMGTSPPPQGTDGRPAPSVTSCAIADPATSPATGWWLPADAWAGYGGNLELKRALLRAEGLVASATPSELQRPPLVRAGARS